MDSTVVDEFSNRQSPLTDYAVRLFQQYANEQRTKMHATAKRTSFAQVLQQPR